MRDCIAHAVYSNAEATILNGLGIIAFCGTHVVE